MITIFERRGSDLAGRGRVWRAPYFPYALGTWKCAISPRWTIGGADRVSDCREDVVEEGVEVLYDLDPFLANMTPE